MRADINLPKVKATNVRESSFELLRLIAMFTIVMYHFYQQIWKDWTIPFNEAIQIPIHIGVPIFVLISGYWGIRISGRGLARLLGQMAVYSIPMLLIYNYLTNGGGKEVIKSLLFVSNTRFWFMRTYLCLYFISPIINHYLKDASIQKRIYALFAFGFIGVYLGMMAQNDPALHNFCNLTIFMFQYVVGDTLHRFEHLWRPIKMRYLVTTFLVLNIMLVALICLFPGTLISHAASWLSFPYNSVLMQVNAVLFLMIVVKHPFQSKAVNWLGASSLAIYLIGSTPLLRRFVFNPMCQEMVGMIHNEYLLFVVLIVPALLTIFLCIFIDKLFTPIWKAFQVHGEHVEKKIVGFFKESSILRHFK